jgi:WD40 repeat protein
MPPGLSRAAATSTARFTSDALACAARPEVRGSVSWSPGNRLWLWGAASGQPIGPAMRHDGEVTGALWSGDGARILSWSSDNTLRLWDAKWPKGSILEVACALTFDRDLAGVSQRTGISITEPICTPEQLSVPIDWSKIERAASK